MSHICYPQDFISKTEEQMPSMYSPLFITTFYDIDFISLVALKYLQPHD